jgi:hypothetical protein
MGSETQALASGGRWRSPLAARAGLLARLRGGPSVPLGPRTLRHVTLVLTALATAVVELALADVDAPPFVPVAMTVGWLALALAVAWYVGRFVTAPDSRGCGTGHKPAPVAAAILVALLVLPLLVEAVRGGLRGQANPLELVLLGCGRNLGLGLAALAAWPLCLRLAALVSLFMVLVGSSLASGPVVVALLGAYVAAGCCWLMLLYWSGLRWHGAAEGTAHLPLAAPLLIVAVTGSIVGTAWFGPTRRLLGTLAELLPSSGGTQTYNPYARGGVNDGDDEVAATENAHSTGFTQSDVFLDSDQPTLYDAFNDLYGEPFKPRDRELAPAIALPGQPGPPRKAQAENLKAGREFPLLRQGRKPGTPPSSRAADALLYVRGKTPLHLRLAAYDRFDGVTWTEAPHQTLAPALELDPTCPPWFRLTLRPSRVYSGTEAHAIKVARLATRALPVPPHLQRFRIGKVDRPNFFEAAQEGILCMRGRTIPSTTTIETEAWTPDPRRLREVLFGPQPPGINQRYLTPVDGGEVSRAVADLACRWAAGTEHGWGQVEAVVARLRQEYVHDRGARPPADCPDVVAHFLLESRRGPDYLFASSAAVLLRSLGYPTRVVSGFYVAPERYDRASGHTPVVAEDSHFWAEVQLPTGIWITVEPTPGYDLMEPAFPWTERLAAALGAVGSWLWQHAPALAVALVALALLAWRRRGVYDRLATLGWWLAPSGTWRHCVLRTVRLVERRARWAGRPRPPGQTLARWYGPPARAAAPDLGLELQRLIALADRAAHAPESSRTGFPDVGEARSLCRRVVGGWTVRRFRVVPPSPPAAEARSWG